MSIDDMIAVLQAAQAGKTIQRRNANNIHAEWEDMRWSVIPWDFCLYEFRVKPEPLECWVNVYHEFIAAYMTKEEAMAIGDKARLIRRVHMREVVE